MSEIQKINAHYVITKELPSDPVSECYRKIKTNIDLSNADNNIKVIQITSGVQGEGKTTTLINLATVFAEDSKKVLIIDLDLRRPQIHHFFNAINENGLVDYLADKIKKEDVIKHSDNKYIDYIIRGSSVPYPASILNSQKLKDFVDSVKDKYDVVLLDCPPILVVTDSLIISKMSDGLIFVVSQIVANKNDSIQAIKSIKKNNINILGTIFTNVSKKYSNAYDGYYSNRYYKYFGTEDKKKSQ
jgi:protein-tyrosine kinase